MAGARVPLEASRASLRARSRRPQRRARHRSSGHLAALEGVFVGLLMVSSIAIYVSLDLTPGLGSVNGNREPVEDLARDLLTGLKDIPSAEAYATQLERAIAKGVQGNTSTFETLVKRTLPPGAECRLYVDNGHARRQVAGPSERLARESVSQSQLWMPEWAYAFALPSLDLIHAQMPLQVQAYEVSQGSLVKESGVPVQFTLTTNLGTYDRAGITALRSAPTVSILLRNETGGLGFAYKEGLLAWTSQNQWTSSASGPLPTPQTFSVPSGWDYLNVTLRVTGAVIAYTATFTDPLGIPWPVVATTAGTFPLSIPFPQAGTWTFTGAGTITGILGNPASAVAWANVTKASDVRNYTVLLRESAGQPLPAGTVLNLTLPDVFQDLAYTPSPQSGWANIKYGEPLDQPNWVSAELSAPLSNGQLEFTFQGRRPANGNALYAVQAALSGAAYGRATLIVGGSTGLTTLQNTVEHEMYVAVPKPVAPGSTSTWGAAFPLATGLAGLTETVTQLDVATADGSALFAAVQGLAPAGTWTLVSPSHLRWTGSQVVGANTALSFAFNVTATTATVQDEPAIRVPVGFGASNFSMQDMDKPYVYQLSVPPPTDVLGASQAGYTVPAAAGPLTWGQAQANITQVQRGALVAGSAAYNVSTFGTLSSIQESLRTGLARSHLNLSKQAVGIGESVAVTVDLQGLYDNLLALGATISAWNVELSIYDPAQPFQPYRSMEPSFRGKWGAGGSLALDTTSGATDVPAVADWVLDNSADIKTPARGTLNFTPPRDAFYGPHALVAQANFALNDGLGNSLLQSARVLAVLDVLPDSGQSGTALYWTTIECWLADW